MTATDMRRPIYFAPRVYSVKLKKCAEKWTWELADRLGPYFDSAQDAAADMQKFRDNKRL